MTDAGPTRFAFEVRSFGLPVSRRQHDIEPTAEGCRVTESTWDRRPGWFRPLTAPATGVRDRGAEDQRNIERTLARLKDAVERPVGMTPPNHPNVWVAPVVPGSDRGSAPARSAARNRLPAHSSRRPE